ncbi:IPTL-CTERM sorting domain-containing protein [Pseudomonadota bacterium]
MSTRLIIRLMSVALMLCFIASGSVFAADGTPGGFLEAPAESNCFISRNAPGCDDAECEALVSAVDSFCTDVSWDGICVGEAFQLCTIETAADIARFGVDKDFSDDNPMAVEVTMVCNDGFQNQPSFEITEERGATFILEGYADGLADCTITETVPDGYTASYTTLNGTSQDGCVFTDIPLGVGLACDITNTVAPVDITIDAVWTVDGDANDISETGYASLACNNAGVSVWPVDGDTSQTVSILPPDTCVVSYGSDVSGVEATGCEEPITIAVGDAEQTCTVEFTVFFEGIPTINQYGLAIMVLLMLGVGFVGFRRFV